MGYVEPEGQALRDLGLNMAVVSGWIDAAPANVARDPEAQTWGRLAKVAEESGEVIAAWIGATGQNPRKGVCDSDEHVVEELLDVALTALAAWEHMTGNKGGSGEALKAHTILRMKRVGLA